MIAGAAKVDITPDTTQFLYGYPHVRRYSTGTHDPLLSTALYVEDGESALFIANDLIHFSKDHVAAVRREIARRIPVSPERIMISASHTHSGPIMVYHINAVADPVVPQPDPGYSSGLVSQIAQVATEAYERRAPVSVGFTVADGSCVGTNRRDPRGVSDPEVPVLLVSDIKTGKTISCMVVCNMHPTVLHEDSTLYSADFPWGMRKYLSESSIGPDCVVLYHTGPSGNQSPRHVTRGNTFDDALRLGSSLGSAVEQAIQKVRTVENTAVKTAIREVPFIPRVFPDSEEADARLQSVEARFRSLQEQNAPKQEIRTAECDWFGAEEVVALSRCQTDGSLAKAQQSTMPAEIQAVQVGPLIFVAWPCEVFVEYGLEVKAACDNVFVISLANGETQGYIVTEEAEAEGGYEASNGLFTAASGAILVKTTIDMVNELRDGGAERRNDV